VKILKIILIALTAFLLTACSSNGECKPIETKIYIDNPKPYPVVVPCKIQDVKCGKLIGSAIEKQDLSLKCIADIRKSIEGCK